MGGTYILLLVPANNANAVEEEGAQNSKLILHVAACKVQKKSDQQKEL